MYTKYKGSGTCCFDKTILKPIFWPCYLLTQLAGTILTIFLERRPRIMCGFYKWVEEVKEFIVRFPYVIQCKLVTSTAELLGWQTQDVMYQIRNLWASCVETVFLNCIFIPIFRPLWPTYATNQNHLNNFCWESSFPWNLSSKHSQSRC